MKKKILVIAAIMGCLALVTAGTIAYFTAEEVTHNVITTGDIEIELQEFQKDDDGNLIIFTNPVDSVMPSMEISKIVQIKNTGSNAAYVRIKVTKAIELAEDVEEEPDLDLVLIDFDTVNWELIDGFYYYKTALNPGETTEPLFTTVTFATTMGNMYQNSTATVEILAHATQVANNGSTVYDADGWPAVNP